jgi:Tol biopolymer transport system component
MASFRDLFGSFSLLSVAASLGCQGDALIQPTLGTLKIQIATTGAGPDADGYTVRVDAAAARAVGLDASFTLDAVAGRHSVGLADLASNCDVAGENPRPTDVPAGDTVGVEFVVRCSSLAGNVVLVTSTSGSFPDPDGYRATIDGTFRANVAANSIQSPLTVLPGEHQAGLEGVAANCTVLEHTSKVFTVVTGAADTVSFKVDCSSAPPIAFGNGHINLVNPDGSGLRDLTPDDANFSQPVWSPDGEKIVAVSDVDLWVMNSDGTGRSKLTETPELSFRTSTHGYRWSPDGTSIAFVRDTVALTPSGTPDASCDGVCLIPQIWVMAANGSGARRIATGDQPSWSPHSLRITFTCDTDPYAGRICVMNSDGSGLIRVADLPMDTPAIADASGAGDAQWSPAGGRIAFVAYQNRNPSGNPRLERDIFLVNPDGSDLVNLTQGRGDYTNPRWSPDGNRIAFAVRHGTSSTAIGIMNRDGTGERILFRDAAYDEELQWAPDASALLFTRFPFPQDSLGEGALVISSDGVTRINASKGFASGLSWSPRH